MLLSVAIAYSELGVITKVIAVILFLFVTAPIATHMIVRAAYLTKVPQWKGTVVDELKGCYERESGELQSGAPMPEPPRPSVEARRPSSTFLASFPPFERALRTPS